jgi:hypothetical protein
VRSKRLTALAITWSSALCHKRLSYSHLRPLEPEISHTGIIPFLGGEKPASNRLGYRMVLFITNHSSHLPSISVVSLHTKEFRLIGFLVINTLPSRLLLYDEFYSRSINSSYTLRNADWDMRIAVWSRRFSPCTSRVKTRGVIAEITLLRYLTLI